MGRTDKDRALDAVVGLPPVIEYDLSTGTLLQAFVTAVTIFDGNDNLPHSDRLPTVFLQQAYRTLKNRVRKSDQKKAGSCLKAFEKQYESQLSILISDRKLKKIEQSTEGGLNKSFDSTKKIIKKYQKHPNDKNLKHAYTAYDALVSDVLKDDSDEAHERLDSFKEKHRKPIQAINKLVKKEYNQTPTHPKLARA